MTGRIRHGLGWLIMMMMMIAATEIAMGTDLHVSMTGSNDNDGGQAKPLKTIQRASELAQPGDTITVHEGVYRERINPPRGGTSDKQRITYQAAPGEHVVIKGSEVVTGWVKQEGDTPRQARGSSTWRVTLPNRFFGEFNPYRDLIKGDWYQARQPYHTGAVYLNGHWLKEAPRKSVVVGTDGADESESELMNVEFMQVSGGTRVYAVDRSSQGGDAAVVELSGGKRCLGPLKDGDWLAFEGVDFGKDSDSLLLSTGSPVGGGFVEIHLGSAEGASLGRLDAGLTAEWTHFQIANAKLNQALSGKQTIVLVFKARPVAPVSASDLGYWFAEVADDTTTLWAQFKDADPNQGGVEINVRQSVFYPESPGRNYITVRGFTLEQAATPWSPPTAEQIGLIGAHWCKGWIIEDNTIRYSACTGITLGKHGDEFDNAGNYNRTIRLGLENGWNRETLGSHLVRNNHILHCGQAGIVGSLGCSFSTITGNEIHEIRQHHQYGGCETAGIKLHGAIDVLIADNHIYRCEHWGGIWLDWMGQGARVSGNLLHDNSNDLMFEMNHGPMLIDNNILLSPSGVRDASGGGAYVHNLIVGTQSIWADLTARKTPIFKPHSTDVIVSDENRAALWDQWGGIGFTVDQDDDRFFNNLFVKAKTLSAYDDHQFEIQADGNVFLAGTQPSKRDRNSIVAETFDPGIKLEDRPDGWWLEMNVDPAWKTENRRSVVTSERLGKATVPDAPFENRDGTPYRIDTDYFGRTRSSGTPAPGPFRLGGETVLRVNVWPKR